jgi:hypothetical protein
VVFRAIAAIGTPFEGDGPSVALSPRPIAARGVLFSRRAPPVF